MKKEYVTPELNIITFESENNIMADENLGSIPDPFSNPKASTASKFSFEEESQQ